MEVIWEVHQAKAPHQNAKQPTLNIQEAGNNILPHQMPRTHVSRLRRQIIILALMNECTSHSKQPGHIHTGIEFISQIDCRSTTAQLHYCIPTSKMGQSFIQASQRWLRVKAPFTLISWRKSLTMFLKRNALLQSKTKLILLSRSRSSKASKCRLEHVAKSLPGPNNDTN